MASLFSSFSAAPVDVEIKLAGEEDRKQVEVKGDKDQKVMCPVYYDGESVVGQVHVRIKDGKKFQHDGIRIELVGSIGEWALPVHHRWCWSTELESLPPTHPRASHVSAIICTCPSSNPIST